MMRVGVGGRARSRRSSRPRPRSTITSSSGGLSRGRRGRAHRSTTRRCRACAGARERAERVEECVANSWDDRAARADGDARHQVRVPGPAQPGLGGIRRARGAPARPLDRRSPTAAAAGAARAARSRGGASARDAEDVVAREQPRGVVASPPGAGSGSSPGARAHRARGSPLGRAQVERALGGGQPGAAAERDDADHRLVGEQPLAGPRHDQAAPGRDVDAAGRPSATALTPSASRTSARRWRRRRATGRRRARASASRWPDRAPIPDRSGGSSTSARSGIAVRRERARRRRARPAARPTCRPARRRRSLGIDGDGVGGQRGAARRGQRPRRAIQPPARAIGCGTGPTPSPRARARSGAGDGHVEDLGRRILDRHPVLPARDRAPFLEQPEKQAYSGRARRAGRRARCVRRAAGAAAATAAGPATARAPTGTRAARSPRASSPLCAAVVASSRRGRRRWSPPSRVGSRASTVSADVRARRESWASCRRR